MIPSIIFLYRILCSSWQNGDRGRSHSIKSRGSGEVAFDFRLEIFTCFLWVVGTYYPGICYSIQEAGTLHQCFTGFKSMVIFEQPDRVAFTEEPGAFREDLQAS